MVVMAASQVEGGVSLTKWMATGCPHCSADLNAGVMQINDALLIRRNECGTVYIVPAVPETVEATR